MATTVLLDWSDTLEKVPAGKLAEFLGAIATVDPSGVMVAVCTAADAIEVHQKIQPYIKQDTKIVGVLGEAAQDCYFIPNYALEEAGMKEQQFLRAMAQQPCVLVDDASRLPRQKIDGMRRLLGQHGLTMPKFEWCQFKTDLAAEPAYYEKLAERIAEHLAVM